MILREKVTNETLKSELCEKEFSLQRKEFETAIEEAHLSQSTVINQSNFQSLLNLSQERDDRVAELEAELETTKEDFEIQMQQLQVVFKRKLVSIKQFALPFKIDASDFSQGRNENFSQDLVEFAKTRVSIGMKQNKTLTETTNFVR